MQFGDFVTIEQLRHGADNEFYQHKVIGVFQSNIFVDVPVKIPRTETLHKEMVDVAACVCCGVDEREILNYPITKITIVAINSHKKLIELLKDAQRYIRSKDPKYKEIEQALKEAEKK